MHAALRAEGGTASRGRVARLMRRHGIRALAGRRFKPCTTDSRHYQPIAPNLLKQDFLATAPNRVWLADITYIPTGEGWLYLAAVLDLVTRKIVGWAMRDNMRTELPLAALMMAAQRQRPAEGLICHSDRGNQYAAEAYGKQLAAIKAMPSMSRTACCYNNAPMESFFHTSRSNSSISDDGQLAKRRNAICSPISRDIITGGGSTPLSDTGPRNRRNDKWPKPVSTNAGDHQGCGGRCHAGSDLVALSRVGGPGLSPPAIGAGPPPPIARVLSSCGFLPD